VRASDVTPRSVEWLLLPYIPLGKISVVAGQMGQAKSLFTAWLAAWTTPSGVVMLSAEDDPADTIRPRLEAVGADLERVEIAPDVTLDPARLGEMCDAVGDVRLITIDPIQAYLPSSVNSWKGQDVRLALDPIRQLAADRELAVVLIQHLNRRTDGDPLARIADSQGVPQLARSVMIWGPDPSDPEGDQGSAKALTRVKGNLARGSNASATFTIAEKMVTGDIRAPMLTRGLDAHITADDVVADHETRSARDEAVEWLRTLLADGPVRARDAQRQAQDIGISARTLARAKLTAGVKSEQSRDENNISGWVWHLPGQSYTCGTLGIVGTVGTLGRSKDAKDAKKAKVATVTQNGRPRHGVAA
jgi:putative DNA primase/helicase